MKRFPAVRLRNSAMGIILLCMLYIGFYYISRWLELYRVVASNFNTLRHYAKEQDARRAALQAYCDASHQHPRTEKYLFIKQKHAFVDEKHGALYCLIPKVGSTSWKKINTFLFRRMLVNISSGGGMTVEEIGDPHNREMLAKHGIRGVNEYSQANMDEILETYLKIAIVRHPLTRLLSAYRDKIVEFNSNHPDDYKRVAQFIIHTYRVNASTQSLRTGKTATFPEFVKYIIDLKAKNASFNKHWMSYNHMCSFCNVGYDYIVKMDSVSDDFIRLRHNLFHDSPAAVLPPQYSSPTVAQMVQKFFSNVTQADFEKLIDIYEKDFQMFGYDPYEFHNKTQPT